MPDLLRDPVCGMEIRVGDAIASAVTEGRRFHFCCPRCHAAFVDTPHRFVGWPGEPGPSRLPSSPVATAGRPGLRPCHFTS